MSAIVMRFQDPIGLELGSPKPANLVLFSDRGSFSHVMLGVLAGAVPPPFNLATAALFAGYGVSKLQAGQTPARVGGKFVEFGLGLIAAGLIGVLVK